MLQLACCVTEGPKPGRSLRLIHAHRTGEEREGDGVGNGLAVFLCDRRMFKWIDTRCVLPCVSPVYTKGVGFVIWCSQRKTHCAKLPLLGNHRFQGRSSRPTFVLLLYRIIVTFCVVGAAMGCVLCFYVSKTPVGVALNASTRALLLPFIVVSSGATEGRL